MIGKDSRDVQDLDVYLLKYVSKSSENPIYHVYIEDEISLLMDFYKCLNQYDQNNAPKIYRINFAAGTLESIIQMEVVKRLNVKRRNQINEMIESVGISLRNTRVKLIDVECSFNELLRAISKKN